MLANLFATVSLTSTITPSAACSVRFYYPPGDRRTSYHQIYLCDLKGKSFKQLTFDRSEKLEVFWLDANTVGWRQSLSVTKAETWLGYHHPETEKTQVVTLNLKNGKRKAVQTGFFGKVDDLVFPREMNTGVRPVFVEYSKPFDPDRPPVRIWGVKNGRLISSTKIEEMIDPWSNDGETFPNPFLQLGLKCSFKSGETLQNTFGGYESSGQSGVLTLNGRDYIWPVADLRQAWKSSDGRKLYAENRFHSGSAGVYGWIFEMDLETAKWRVIADSIADQEFDPNKRYWVALGNHKETMKLGNLSVWTRRLVAGDRTLGNQWNLTSRPISADSIAIRPN